MSLEFITAIINWKLAKYWTPFGKWNFEDVVIVELLMFM